MLELGKLGTTTDGEGNSTYQPWKNPLLQQGVIGLNENGSATPMNPNTFAEGLVADAIANALNGEVVADPQAANWNVVRVQATNGNPWPSMVRVRVLAVQLPGKDPMNVGYLCDILGNDVAYGSARKKSWEICSILGLPFDTTIADALYRAVMADGR